MRKRILSLIMSVFIFSSIIVPTSSMMSASAFIDGYFYNSITDKTMYVY